ncbi:hypothetical protein JW826_01915 [Candidatus Woesearchaeota archaeon]|nr:hypothetical protein [Candidatus Woesearchaeota archaeon]
MAIVIITERLKEDIFTNFKGESKKILIQMNSLKENPKKGKELTCIGKTILKEIKYKKWRFYFITDGYKLKFLRVEELNDLLIKFVRMSGKKEQQETIDEIKKVLRMTGEAGF